MSGIQGPRSNESTLRGDLTQPTGDHKVTPIDTSTLTSSRRPSIFSAIAAKVSAIVNPLFGALSDPHPTKLEEELNKQTKEYKTLSPNDLKMLLEDKDPIEFIQELQKLQTLPPKVSTLSRRIFEDFEAEAAIKFIKRLEEDLINERGLYNTLSRHDFEILFKDKDPIEVIELLQNLKPLLPKASSPCKNIFKEFEMKAAAKFIEKLQEDLINQKGLYNTLSRYDLEILFKDKNPIKVIQLLQKFQTLLHEVSSPCKEIFKEFEMKAAAKFIEKLQEDLINQKGLYNTLSPNDLAIFFKNKNPIKVIRLLQKFQTLLPDKNSRCSYIFRNFEVEASAKLFSNLVEAKNSISQKNFADEEFGIKSGGANYCCGSMSTAALVAKMAKQDKTIEEILKEGVIRHLKLPPEQMFNCTSLKMFAKFNKDILIGKNLSEKNSLKNSISIDRYEKFLSDIGPGSSGQLTAVRAAIMYVSNEDGSVEIFDSHGSSISLIVGHTQPAYRAFFKSATDAAAYLSVHRYLPKGCPLFFYPMKVKQ